MNQSLHISNHLLASLSADELAGLLPHLKAVELPQETVFFESGDAIKAVYFPHNALISLVVDLACGGIIEAAMIGRDGVAGGSTAFGSKISPNRAIVQFSAISRTEMRCSGPSSRDTSSLSWRRRSSLRPVMPHTRSRPAYHAGCCAAGICCSAMTFRLRTNSLAGNRQH